MMARAASGTASEDPTTLITLAKAPLLPINLDPTMEYTHANVAKDLVDGLAALRAPEVIDVQRNIALCVLAGQAGGAATGTYAP